MHNENKSLWVGLTWMASVENEEMSEIHRLNAMLIKSWLLIIEILRIYDSLTPHFIYFIAFRFLSSTIP